MGENSSTKNRSFEELMESLPNHTETTLISESLLDVFGRGHENEHRGNSNQESARHSQGEGLYC